MTFESMVSETVKKAVREAVTEELLKLPSLLPAAVSSSEWMDEEEFRARYWLKSRDGLMAAVKTGRFPQPIKFSEGITFWRKADIHDLCRRIEDGAAG